MSTLSFPPYSLLSRIKKISVKVTLEGKPPALIDEIIKQLVGGALNNAGNSIERVSNSEAARDATLKVYVLCGSLEDDQDRSLGDMFLLQFALLTNLPGIPSHEEVMIWSKVASGFVLDGSLYTRITELIKLSSAELVSAMLEQSAL